MNHLFDSLGLEEDFLAGSRGTLVVFGCVCSCSPVYLLLSTLKGELHAGLNLNNSTYASLIVLLQLFPTIYIAGSRSKSFVFVFFCSINLIIAGDNSIVYFF